MKQIKMRRLLFVDDFLNLLIYVVVVFFCYQFSLHIRFCLLYASISFIFYVSIKFKFSNTYINFYIIAKWFPCCSHRAQNKRDGDKIIVYDFMLASVEKNICKNEFDSVATHFLTDIIFLCFFFNSHQKEWIFPNKNDIFFIYWQWVICVKHERVLV